MTLKRVYRLLTVGLLLLSVGAGFAMREKKSHKLAALQSLQTASLQLGKMERRTPERLKTQALIDEAIHNLSVSVAPEDRQD